MNDTDTKSSVVVGIDGSDTAIEAALWAIDEAVSRSVPLRLVCVTKAKHPSADIARFLKNNDERVQLAVISGAEADQVADILGPYGHHRFSHTGSSVLVVRG